MMNDCACCSGSGEKPVVFCPMHSWAYDMYRLCRLEAQLDSPASKVAKMISDAIDAGIVPASMDEPLDLEELERIDPATARRMDADDDLT